MNLVRAGRRIAILLSLLSCSGADLRAQDVAQPATLSVPEYIARLDVLMAAVALGNPPEGQRTPWGDIPLVWRVQTAQRTFEIPTTWLAPDLLAWETRRDEAAQARLLHQLRTLRFEAASFEQTAGEATAERARLEEILSGREFRNVRGPTWVDRLRQQVFALLETLIGRLILSSAFPTISSVLVYGVVAIAVIVLALWAYRLFRREAAAEAAPADRLFATAKEWPAWLVDAQSAAADGRWREGIHFAYWCAVSFLEANGAWRPDRARTPREYLSLVPASSDARSPLSALTRQFERVWYGTDKADARAFDEAMTNLKKMGCLST